jgi:multicomponent Na+:H+ antiporter subunit G
MTIIETLGVVAVAVGLFFSAAGIVGFVRLPDIYTRIHAAGKVATMGIFGLSLGVALIMPETTPKLIALTLLLLITLPVASHAVAYAAYKQNVERVGALRDDLAELEAAQKQSASSAE